MPISSFHDVLFPLSVSFGATGGPERRIEVVQLTSGKEQRNARQAHSRRHYDAGTGVRSIDELREVLRFFEARRGKLTAFRFRDPFDFASRDDGLAVTPSDQALGTGNGSAVRFKLVKSYGTGAEVYKRPIRKPAGGTLRVAVAGVEKTVTTHFSFDDVTGDIVFTAGSVPANGAAVTAGYEFHVPVRFDLDRLTVSLTAFKAGQVPTIPLVEVLS
jgi:uncharacterized protein (TIGR02217 family)